MTKKQKRRRRRVIARILLVVIFGGAVWLAVRGVSGLIAARQAPAVPEQTQEAAEDTAASAQQPVFTEPEQSAPAPYEKGAEITEKDGVTYLTLNGYTMLYVNKQYSVPRDYGGGIDAEAGAAVQRLYDAAAADGLTIYTVSGYRSYDTQKSIYENYVATKGQAYTDTISAKPGTSEHQTGLAFDVGAGSDTSTVLSQRFANTPEYAWLQEHMAEYGFILRYPDGKTDWTGYAYEPWHIRYVGPELAQYIRSTGLCVEELAQA